MLKKIKQFIKYNTFTAIIIAISFVAIASVAASNENIKKNVIGEEIVETHGVDNTLLLAADLDNFDMKMKIINVTEDAENYYIDYQYRTFEIQEDVWKEILKKNQLIISKKSLSGKDLGLYVTEELGEIIDYEIDYLKEVQENEKEKGETYVTETTKYTGLIGLILDTETKELPGYEPVVKPTVAKKPRFREDSVEQTENNESHDESREEETPQDDSTQSMEPTDTGTPDESQEEDDSSAPQPSWTMDPEPTDNVSPDKSQEEKISQEDYEQSTEPTNNVSSDESQKSSTSSFTCDVDHLTLCDTEEICVEIGLFWYEDECHLEEKIVK